MKKFYLTFLPNFILAIATLVFISGCGNRNETEGEEYDEYDGPGEALLFEIERTKDPATGRVPMDKFLQAKLLTEQARADARNSNRINALSWIERGPNGDFSTTGNPRPSGQQTSGRIRAVMVDSLDPTHNTVWVGGVDGGLWKTTDITASPANWTPVNDFLDNLAIAAICQDPRPGFQNTMYFCTGESYGNADAVRGVGVFKSVDGGATWNFLSSTSSYTSCTRILCDFQGNVYLGARNVGLLRSTDGGTSWTNITPSGIGNSVCDLEISSTSGPARLHVTTGIFSTSGYRYTDNPATVTSGSGWNAPTTDMTSFNQRIELGISGNTLYALPCNSSYQVPTIWKSVDGGDNWSSTTSQPAGNWANGQGWYDLSIGINPSNSDECIVGGLDCYKTSTGGTSWVKISGWATSTPGFYIHADQHNIQWWDGGSKLVFACDGGIHYSSNGGTSMSDRNKGLRLKQFYSVAIHPTATNYFIAGAQDNGMHRLNHPGLDSSAEVVGGDGCYSAIDQDEPQYQFGSYVYNVYRRSINNGATWTTPVNNQSSGRFVNPWDYDNTGNIIYACNNSGTYLRWNNPQTGNSTEVVSAGFGGNVSAVHVSPYTANRVYFGMGSGGLVYAVDNANTGTTVTPTNITPPGATGYVNCIVTGGSDQDLLVCISSYGVNNIWLTTNGGTTWTACDGNLPDMPVRWALFHPDTDTKAYIATETGVWETDLLNGASTVWSANPSFPNVRTDMIKYRASDRTIAAGTHGRGIWSATIPAPTGFTFNNPGPATATCPAPASMNITLGTNSNGGFTNPITLSATGNPGGTTVSFSPNPVTPGSNTTVTLNGTNTLAPGSYVITVTGTASGAPNQSVDLTYTINPGAGPAITTQPLNQTVCAGSNATFSIASASATGFQWQVSTNGGTSWADIGGATTNSYTITGATAGMNGNQYRCIASTACGSTISTAAILTVNSAANITVQPSDATVCSGGNTTLCVTATGTNLSYQWESSPTCGGAWTNVTGAINNCLTVTPVANIAYRCNVTSASCGSTVTSNCATVTVVSSLTITTQPTDVTVCVGGNASFTVAATGSGINYQWQVSTNGGTSWSDIGGANAATYTATGVTAGQSGNQYRCNLTSPCGNATSNPALLTVNTLPAITAHPQNVNICAGSSATFSVTATGTGLTYQWQVSTDGGTTYTNITGETASSLTINPVTLAMNNNRYRCVVSGACTPAATSNAAILTTATSIVITTNPANPTICEGTNTSFTVAATGSGLNYQWQVSTDGGTSYTAVTNSTIYSGATTATLTITAAPPSLNGNRYRAVVTNASCSPGTSSAALLTVNTFPQITTQPQNSTICEGGGTTFSVAATTGVGTLSYQWQVSTDGGATYTNISGATSTSLALTQITAAATGYRYRVVVTAGCGSVTSNGAILTVNTLPVITFNAPAVVCKSDGSFTLSATPSGGTFSGANVSGSVFSPSAAGVGAASVTYTATNAGCVSTVTRTIQVNECPERHLTLDQYPAIIVYPNPNDGQFKIKINTDLYTNLNMKMYNNDGQMVATQTFTGIGYGSVLSVDMSKLPGGTYHLYLHNNEHGNSSKSVSLIIYR
ncbi:MAG TPA: T9SS type A sorting domain-containing protein [Chitinophagaceae bacterium]|nr:T9SS type A sorting domain-containing protein [Chitinophagaceae bacterium]